MSYTKLFSSLVHSTIWQAPDHVRLVWITMLALKDRDGIVEASIPGLAAAARVSITDTEDAIDVLSAPDRYSRTPDHEGRRIETIRGGWCVLNHDVYREKDDADERREKDAARQARKRARAKVSRDGHARSRQVTPSETDTDPHDLPEISLSGSGSPGLSPSGASGSGPTDLRDLDSVGFALEPDKPKPKRQPRQHGALPPDWKPERSAANLAAEQAARSRGIDLAIELQQLVDWALANAERKADWNATWRGWTRRARPMQRAGPSRWTTEDQLERVRRLEAEEAAERHSA